MLTVLNNQVQFRKRRFFQWDKVKTFSHRPSQELAKPVLSLLEHYSSLTQNVDELQALILAPTRELADQINDVVSAIGKFLKVRTALAVGGVPVSENIRELQSEKPPHIVIGCLGRVLDLVEQRHALQPHTLRVLVLDEADEMLSQGFKEQTHTLFQYLPQDVQVCLFSATIPVEVETLTQKFLRSPTKILVKQEMLTLEGIKQYFIAVDSDNDKFEVLKDLFGAVSMSQCIVYCNTRRQV
jgi:translation initiation factor 4A